VGVCILLKQLIEKFLSNTNNSYFMHKPHERLLSLDFFRGFTIMGMILVNSIGKYGPIQLHHSDWHGWTFADLIVPFFLFIMGVSMVFSLKKRMGSGSDKKVLLVHALRRSCLLFSLGIFLNLFPTFDFYNIHWLGVLQFIALGYFFSSFIFLFFSYKQQVFLTFFILLVYTLFLVFVPVPGYGSGYFTKEINVVNFFNAFLFNGGDMGGLSHHENVLLTLPVISVTLFGVLVGNILSNKNFNLVNKHRYLYLSGLSLFFISLLLSIWVPINRKLFTSSYAVLSTGIALVILSFCYWLMDIKQLKKWAFPFVVFGLNPITLYFFSSVVAISSFTFPYGGLLLDISKGVFGLYTGSLLYAIANVLFFYIIAFFMYKKKWFIKV